MRPGRQSAESVELVRQAQQNDVLIYAIGLLTERRKDRSHPRQTGPQSGWWKAQVSRCFIRAMFPKQSGWRTNYSPTNQTLDESFRQIRVAVKGSESLVARTRQGCYATKDASTGANKGS